MKIKIKKLDPAHMAVSKGNTIYFDAEKFRKYPSKIRYKEFSRVLATMLFEWGTSEDIYIKNFQRLTDTLEQNKDVIASIVCDTRLDKVLN